MKLFDAVLVSFLSIIFGLIMGFILIYHEEKGSKFQNYFSIFPLFYFAKMKKSKNRK